LLLHGQGIWSFGSLGVEVLVLLSGRTKKANLFQRCLEMGLVRELFTTLSLKIRSDFILLSKINLLYLAHYNSLHIRLFLLFQRTHRIKCLKEEFIV
jgi:hypothetical protein